MPKKEQEIQPINASLDVVDSIVSVPDKERQELKATSKIENKVGVMPIALYQGEMKIDDITLGCAVLNNGMRILTAASIFKAFGRQSRGNSRLEVAGIKVPAFMDAKNLEPYINEDVFNVIRPVEYLDGNQKKSGYVAMLLPTLCNIYLSARRSNVLALSQEKLAVQSEILLSALAKVGIDALVDEATGFQKFRSNDALRLLLSAYIEEGLRKWIKTFPDSFFDMLDKMYGNEKTNSRNRPRYYGKFINKYVYNPLENGYIKAELDRLNINDDGTRKAQFHRWLSVDGRDALIRQITRVEARMELFKSIEEFKNAEEKQKAISIAPYLFDEMNKIIEF